MSIPLTLIPSTTRRIAAGGRLLPLPDVNMFTRIIRDPSGGSANLRERQCTEMLASLLLNAPNVCQAVCRHLGKVVGFPIELIDACNFTAATEQPIGCKRDDLRIEGWSKNFALHGEAVLWTIEVKVNSSFHLSADTSNADTNASIKVELKNQLVHYDQWLVRQREFQHRAGIVLALENLQQQLPKGLAGSWRCITWTEVGVLLRNLLRDTNASLLLEERQLCSHVLGFIAAHLWRSAEMPESRIDFEDVAMLRAWSLMADDCELKMLGLINPVRELMKAFPIGAAAVEKDKLFTRYGRCATGRKLSSEATDKIPILWAGITVSRDRESDGPEFSVWIESPPRSRLKAAVRKIHPELVKRNAWDSNDSDSEWWDIWRTMPLTDLLAASNQSEQIRTFVQSSLDDLQKAGLASAIKARKPK